MRRAARVVARLLDEHRNRRVWLAPYALIMVGLSLLAAGLGVDGWWVPGLCLLAIRPVRPGPP